MIVNNNDYKRYFIVHEADKYNWKVYVDGIEGWQNCKASDIDVDGMKVTRATVICESGTQLNRLVEIAIDCDEDEIEPNGCIYLLEK